MGMGRRRGGLDRGPPDAWVVGLDASPDMVFPVPARPTTTSSRPARRTHAFDGPWDLVIPSPPSSNSRRPDKWYFLPPGRRSGRSASSATSSKALADDRRVGGAVAKSPGNPNLVRSRGLTEQVSAHWHPGTGYHLASDGCPEEENFQRTARQAAGQPQGCDAAVEQLSSLPQPAAAAPGLVPPPATPTPGVRSSLTKCAEAPASPPPTRSRGAWALVTVALDGFSG